MKSGFVAIIGRPNAGKSTLLNALLKEKVSITSYKAQTTRNAIIGIYNAEDIQIVFADTPGIHKANSNLGTYMNKEAIAQAEGVDVIYYIVDAQKGLTNEDMEILKNLATYRHKIFLLLNKIDNMSKEKLIKVITTASVKYQFDEIIPISALNEDNLDELIKVTAQYLKDDLAYYPSDMKTSSTMEFRIAEIIREKVLLTCHEEIPHLVATKVESIKEEENKVYIDAVIVCNKMSHKGIIIGKNGSNLKNINMSASKDIKALYHKKVILSLFVKVDEDWMNKDSKLMDLGYFINDKYE